jgi:hypothetical protein
MSIEEALTTLKNVGAKYLGTLEDHQTIQDSLKTVEDELNNLRGQLPVQGSDSVSEQSTANNSTPEAEVV